MDKGAEMERIKFQINFLRYSRGNVFVLRSLIEDALQLLTPLEEQLQNFSSFTTLSRSPDKYLSVDSIKNESHLQDNFNLAQQQALQDIDQLLIFLKDQN